MLAEIEKSEKEDQLITRHLFQEHAGNNNSWENGLMDILCEYHNSSVRYVEVLTEAYSNPDNKSGTEENRVIKFNQMQAGVMKSYLNLIKMNRLLLVHKYNINLEIQ